jgi:hypothetical protein
VALRLNCDGASAFKEVIMSNNIYRLFSAVLLAGGVLTASAACASQGAFYGYQRDYRNFERRAYDNGYREGLEHGEKDARRGRDFAYAHDSEYRDADHGYNRSYGSIDAYRRVFRQGYTDGYTEGYRGSHGGPDYNRPRVGFPSYPVGRGIYERGSVAARIGYRDGYEVGRDDARDRDRFDPRRSKRYREGDHEYNSRYGSRDEYKLEYRAAFQQGYEQGFREYRK